MDGMKRSHDALDAAMIASLGAEIASERAYRGLTQEEVWQRAGISKSAYLKLENGQEGVARTIEQLTGVARALGLTVGELIGRAEAGAPAFVVDLMQGVTDDERADLREAVNRRRPPKPKPGSGRTIRRRSTGT